MGIEELAHISYILFGAAACFLTAAVIMFFKFDIRRIYRILKSAADSQSAPPLMSVEKSGSDTQRQLAKSGRTQKYEQTLALDTVKFILVQDITYSDGDVHLSILPDRASSLSS